jgi:hypothetical protein
LTAELADARPGEKIGSVQFAPMDDTNEFYNHCVNILSNIFISYTYKD